MLENATALMNTARREGQWYALVTEQQLNGWLAVDLAENHQDLLPAGAVELRVRIRAGSSDRRLRLRVFRTVDDRFGNVRHVLGRAARDRAARPRRAGRAHAGADDADRRRRGQGGRAVELRVEWRQDDGDPVA